MPEKKTKLKKPESEAHWVHFDDVGADTLKKWKKAPRETYILVRPSDLVHRARIVRTGDGLTMAGPGMEESLTFDIIDAVQLADSGNDGVLRYHVRLQPAEEDS